MLHIKDTRKFKLDRNMRTAVALGKFDGLHRGHMLLIDEVMKLQDEGCTGVIFTFDMKENRVFDISTLRTIYTSDEKAAVAKSTGIDVMVEYPFDDTFASMSPVSFISDILVDMLNVSWIVVGRDYRFGKNREGDVDTLMRYADTYGYQVKIVDKLSSDGEIVSSTAIRELISAGNMKAVTPLLGRPYSVTGKVVVGRQLGRTIGIPTANVLPEKRKLYPPAGVYASRVRILSAAEEYSDSKDKHILADMYRTYPAVTNIGDNPTVSDEGNVTIETHILNFNGNIYGSKINIEFTDRIREERKFEGLAELKAQMNRDIKSVSNRQF